MPLPDKCSHGARRGPSARELLQWASLARLLCERGWAASQALATSWRQTYTAAEPSSAGRAAAEAAFSEHCSTITAESCGPNALALSLSRPASWPLPLAAADIAADSGSAAWAAGSAVMTHLLSQLVVLEALLSGQGQQGLPQGSDAALLPAPWLQQHLKGAANGVSSAALLEQLGGTEASQAAADKAVLLIQLAAGCLFERIALESMELGLHRLNHANLVSGCHSILGSCCTGNVTSLL